MTSYTCDKCDKIFTRKDSLKYHIENNACKNYTYFCKFCDKGFTNETNMYRHMRDACKVKKEKDIEKDKIYDELLQMKDEIEKIKKENKQLVERIEKIDKTSHVINNNNINTGTVNNTVNNTNNIIIVGYGNEDLSKLDKTEILKALQNGYSSTIKLTESIHFNPKYPEYHNIYISNMKDKYAMMYDGKKWILTMKEDLINTIYDDKKNYIEENLEVFIASLSQSRKNALSRWLDTDDGDKKVKVIKDNIKLLLYNSRHLPIKCIEANDVKKSNKLSKKVIKDNIIEYDNNEYSNKIEPIKKTANKTANKPQIKSTSNTRVVKKTVNKSVNPTI
jgi:hypothetical protein